MKESGILKLTQQFEITGHIPDALIPYFAQDGRWIGDRRNWRRGVWHAAAKRMRRAILPATRRTSRTRTGRILLTSYVWREEYPALITYCEVMGSIDVPTKAKIHAPNLRAIGGSLHTLTGAAVNLPQLRRVGGDLFAPSCNLRAPRLKSVGGNMMVPEYGFPFLQTVGGNLVLKWPSGEISAPKLAYVGGSLKMRLIRSFRAPVLHGIGQDLIIWGLIKRISVPVLETIRGTMMADQAAEIVAHRLKSVGGSIYSRDAKRFFRGNLIVGGKWHTHPEAIPWWRVNEVAKRALYDPGIEL